MSSESEVQENNLREPNSDSEYEDSHGNDSSSDYEIPEEEYKERLSRAEEKKEQGNTHFKQAEYQLAFDCYTEALDVVPDEGGRFVAILFANRAACCIALKDDKGAIDDCTASIEADGDYIKSYQRRFPLLQEKKQYHDALSDVKKIIDLDPQLASVYRRELVSLEKLSKEQFEKEKDEVLGKMKDLGNFVLGKVGLSLDNFKVNKNAETGAYSINFQQN